MLNYFIENRPKLSTFNLLYRIMHEIYGLGLDLALQKDNLFGDPIFSFFFLKGIIIAHEIKNKFLRFST